MLLADENECVQPGVCGEAACQNQVGSYSCVCATGFVFNPSSMSCLGQSTLLTYLITASISDTVGGTVEPYRSSAIIDKPLDGVVL